MPQIKTVVMLMLENRSLDTVLGWLYPKDSPGPKIIYPPGSDPAFDGIPDAAVNSTWFRNCKPAPGTAGLLQPTRVPRGDPDEGIVNVRKQMYGNRFGCMGPNSNWGDDAPMKGFAHDFARSLTAIDVPTSEVMGAYNEEQLPVLYGLAQNFAVSDRWFCSVPSETDPNRAFAVCGTSQGATGDIPDRIYTAPTLFNGLTGHKSWAIYWQYNGLLDGDPRWVDRQCYTSDKCQKVYKAVENGDGAVTQYSRLLEKLRAHEDIPEFCYVEPYWGWGVATDHGKDYIGLQGNDYHPPTWVGAGEYDLNELWEALKQSKQWPEMLVIISFDEHGGTWDHVSPPSAKPPDDCTAPDGFEFKRLGPRVPTLLVSPYIEPGTVFRAPKESQYDFDHTSTIRTVLEWAGTDKQFIDAMGARVANAPMFDGVLRDTPHLDNKPVFSIRDGYAEQSRMKRPHGWPFEFRNVRIQELRAAAAAASGTDELIAAIDRLTHRKLGP